MCDNIPEPLDFSDGGSWSRLDEWISEHPGDDEFDYDPTVLTFKGFLELDVDCDMRYDVLNDDD